MEGTALAYEQEVKIDDQRSLSVTVNNAGVIVLLAEDPHAIAVVEVPREHVRELLNALNKALALGSPS